MRTLSSPFARTVRFVSAVLATAVVLVACALWAQTAQAQTGLPEPSPLPEFPGFINGAPFGIEFDIATGNIHVTDTEINQIWIYDPVTGQHVTNYSQPNVIDLSGPNPVSKDLDYPADVAFMGDSIYVTYFTSVPETDNRTNAVVKFNRDTFEYEAARIFDQEIVGIDAAGGKVYVAVRGGGWVSVLDGSLTEVVDEIVFTNANENPCRPNDVAFYDDTLFIQVLASGNCGEGIYSRTADGLGGTTFVGSSDGAEGYAISISAEGNIFQSTRAGFRVVQPQSGEAVRVEFDSTAQMTGVGVHPSGRTAWVVERVAVAPRILVATMERCAGEVPTAISSTSFEALVLDSPHNDGLPTDDGGAARNASCTAAGPCRTVGAGQASTTISQRECNALVDLYLATSGPRWMGDFNLRDDYDWQAITTGTGTDTTNPCLWTGVNCLTIEGEGHHVTALSLTNRALAGELPASLSDLSYLDAIAFGRNVLTGPIPDAIGDLTGLEVLRLDGNQFSGTIPSSIGNLTQLETLDASMNQLQGPLPAELGNLSSLQTLQLSHNRISGALPAQIGGLSNVEHIEISNNSLTGSIPPQLGSLAALESVDLSDNGLTGTIPPEIGNLGALDRLSLSDNSLTGSIPPEISGATNLRQLALSNNSLTGPIPAQITSMANLQLLMLGHNMLTGPIPPGMGALSELTLLVLQGNQLTGLIPGELGQLPLTTLDLSWNELRGSIPAGLGDLIHPAAVRLAGNPLVGEVPDLGFEPKYTEEFTLGRGGCLTAEPEVVSWLAQFGMDGEVNTGCTPSNRCHQSLVTLWVHADSELFEGTSDADVILGTPGDDVIDGLQGDDLICGGPGDDQIDGGAGDFRDRVYGGPGDDTILGGFGIDHLFGNSGADTIDGQGGSDRIWGGDGPDVLRGDSGADRMFGGSGNDEMVGMGGQDVMWGGPGDDTMQGTWQSDNLFGGSGNDTMYGAGGKDTLLGEAGNDSLFGGTNTDFLDGGTGSGDVANGGEGVDNPVVQPQTRPANGRLFGGSGCVNAETVISC